MTKHLAAPLAFALMTTPALAGVLEGQSPDPVAELNALYGQICRWTDG